MSEQTDTVPAIRFLDDLAADRADPLLPKSVVVDLLLDLRNLVIEDPLLVAAVDRRLAGVPGATTTPGAWWQSELRALRDLVGDGASAEESAG